MTDQCFFCGDGREEVLETHHVVPKRFGGSDASENLVTVCASCHRGLESLYDKRFYDALGVEPEQADDSQDICGHEDCMSWDTSRLVNQQQGIAVSICDAHRQCNIRGCDNGRVTPVPAPSGVSIYCDKHRVCQRRDCESKDVKVINSDYGTLRLCTFHAAKYRTED